MPKKYGNITKKLKRHATASTTAATGISHNEDRHAWWNLAHQFLIGG